MEEEQACCMPLRMGRKERIEEAGFRSTKSGVIVMTLLIITPGEQAEAGSVRVDGGLRLVSHQ